MILGVLSLPSHYVRAKWSGSKSSRRAGVVRGSERAPESSPRPSEASNRRGPRARPMGTRTPRATSVILVAWTPVLGPRESRSSHRMANHCFTPPAGHCNVRSAPDRRCQINTYVEEVLWPASVDSSSTNSPPAAAASHTLATYHCITVSLAILYHCISLYHCITQICTNPP